MYSTIGASLCIAALLDTSYAWPQLARRASGGCCFHLSASGGPGGDVGQLSDGQNRIGQSNLPTPKGLYCLAQDGSITDGSGRGCILTPPTTQWQCDVGASPNTSFSVGCDGKLQYQGNPSFWACATNDNGGYNIYSQKLPDQPNCVSVTLAADNDDCKSGCHPTPAPPPSNKCPADLPAQFEYPHLIIPVDSSQPNDAMTNSYNGLACKTSSSVFNFDIPWSLQGKKCTLSFLLPRLNQLQTSNYWLSGQGGVRFAQLNSPAVQGTTYATKGDVKQDFGVTTMAPGNAYTVATFDCPAGDRIGIYASPESDTCLNYFQDYNPCPLGLYITSA